MGGWRGSFGWQKQGVQNWQAFLNASLRGWLSNQFAAAMVSNGSMLAYRPAFMASGVHMVVFL
jgi:hypothetical protein